MKTLILVMTTLFIAAVCLLSFKSSKVKTSENPVPLKRSGTAIIMTGAAARIPQEAALLEELYDRGMMKDIVFISGVSSGSLNAVMLNGILSGRFTWKGYREILYNLDNDDVFIQNGKKLPVDTKPLRNFITDVTEKKLGYSRIGDLPIMTSISFTHLSDLDLKKTVYRMCSRKMNPETDTTLYLSDILMASTSFPVAFPPVRIRNVTTIPDVAYIDGGVGDDHVPFKALLDFEKFRGQGVERVYFISRKSDSIPEISEELRVLGVDDKGRFDRMGISLDQILKKGLIKRLKDFATEAPELVPLSYVFIPDFPTDFLMFSFTNLKEQYEMTSEWAKTHNPVPLSDYLLPYLLKK